MTTTRPSSAPLFIPDEAKLCLQSGPVMIVDLEAIGANYRLLASKTRGTTAAVVKGDGYGHGMLRSALTLQEAGARLFFTARLDDAFFLRDRLEPDCIISVLDGANSSTMAEAVASEIVPVINSHEQLSAAVSVAHKTMRPPRVFVHIDTGMNRLGFAHGRIPEIVNSLNLLDVRAYLTHFAAADEMDIAFCERQVAAMRAAVGPLPAAPLSIANSCGIFLDPSFHGDITRPGKSMFGINPLARGDNPMSEPATVLAPVVQVRQLRPGDPVGYSSTWHAPTDRRIAVIAFGYSNGYSRVASNRGSVAFDGRSAPIVGRVSMDLIAVDITELSETTIAPGDVAEIVGPSISYRELAAAMATNEHEALISLGRSCPRIYLGHKAPPNKVAGTRRHRLCS
ncbi:MULTISPECIES: alanine racemase [unclassified Mesorhizobium]|uniref:alanine racemase n=2 Tax=Mesorhizobium TaxID=68287 RepID=UPI000FEA6A65|nr:MULTISPECIES: alanine racemase [unclassified Mesorhizobium]RWB66499.1 MAG: alanine racemase [Mesorhizobium sp.]RWB90733.1 MAG: alanine racemase [Mesorhizobium sp.]TGS64170.1 alanine racemase [Mesorhizobium sp. M3A.F.Ca.ET.201.01.1.1]TGS85893.1 alanine racemase [Mesorhizobium sp. M3A.F.Ca.ET.175.01.1.1]TGT23797.1 alanine racemase [Mesorhizobium sp. M3A.F.Ca.ET.174.01.1.1]